MVRAKSNIGPDSGGFRFVLERIEVAPGVLAQRVLWTEAIEGAAREILGTAETDADDGERNATADADEFLREELAAGPMSAKEVQKLARAAGHSDRTLNRAKSRLGIRSQKGGLRDGWVWVLPPKIATKAEDCRHSEAATFANLGNLRADAAQVEDF